MVVIRPLMRRQVKGSINHPQYIIVECFYCFELAWIIDVNFELNQVVIGRLLVIVNISHLSKQAALATLVLLCGTLLLSAGLSNVFVSNSSGGEGEVGGADSWPRLAGRSQPHQTRPVGRRAFASSSSSTFSSNKRKAATPQRRVVHLDLKGAPPRISYLRRLLPVVRAAGATSLLVEYEDMFPYSGRLANASAENHYTEGEVEQLLDAAAEAGLEVIPLVQTLGHLEHVLKLEEFAHLREDQSTCVGFANLAFFVFNMLL